MFLYLALMASRGSQKSDVQFQFLGRWRQIRFDVQFQFLGRWRQIRFDVSNPQPYDHGTKALSFAESGVTYALLSGLMFELTFSNVSNH